MHTRDIWIPQTQEERHDVQTVDLTHAYQYEERVTSFGDSIA
jgi:hypothetical protein